MASGRLGGVGALMPVHQFLNNTSEEQCSECGVPISEAMTLCAHNLCDDCCPATLCGLGPIVDIDVLTKDEK